MENGRLLEGNSGVKDMIRRARTHEANSFTCFAPESDINYGKWYSGVVGAAVEGEALVHAVGNRDGGAVGEAHDGALHRAVARAAGAVIDRHVQGGVQRQ